MWGEQDSEWFSMWKAMITDKTRLTFYDSSKLGRVILKQRSPDQIHNQFVTFGIDHAVKALLAAEHNAKICIGCSVGGVIAWRAALQGLRIDKLITISSTRLRYEVETPLCQVENYFGEHDPYKPNTAWLSTIGKVTSTLIPGGHDIYAQQAVISKIFKELNL